MKSIYFNEDHELFRQTVRQFMETEVAPHAEAWERDRRIPREISPPVGLPVVRAVALAHGGTAEADASPTGGARIDRIVPPRLRLRGSACLVSSS